VRVIVSAVRERLLKGVFISLALLYALLLLAEPALGPSDEFAFVPTLQSSKYFPMYGEDFPYYNSAELGRFGPLGGQEYNLVALFTPTPLRYFTFNAVELLLFAAILAWILRQFSEDKALIYLAGILVLLVPGFSLCFFKLLCTEKNVLFFYRCHLRLIWFFKDTSIRSISYWRLSAPILRFITRSRSLLQLESWPPAICC